MFKNNLIYLIKSFIFLSLFSPLVLCSSHNELANSCGDIKLQVLGAGGPEVTDKLASSSFLIWIDGKAKIMIDAGGGSSLNFEKSGAHFNDLEALLLTHLHVDHSAALPVYIKAGYFTRRHSSLKVYGPSEAENFPSTDDFVKSLIGQPPNSVYPYLSDNFERQVSTDFLVTSTTVVPEGKIWSEQLTKQISLSAINVNHGPVPALAWRVDYKKCSITFSGDMNGSSGNLEVLAKNTNLLVANNAISDFANPVAKRLHMTPKEIGNIAKIANVERLLLAHFMIRTKDLKQQSRESILKNYRGDVTFARELEFIDILEHVRSIR